jgi:hypothetical protein
MATIANLYPPYNIVSHHTKCQERNGNNNGVNSVAGFIMGPFAPKSSNISALKKMPNSTKVTQKKVIIIWLAKVTFAFLGFLHQGP